MSPPGPSNQEQDKVDTIHIFVLQLDVNEYASIVLSSNLNQSSVINSYLKNFNNVNYMMAKI